MIKKIDNVYTIKKFPEKPKKEKYTTGELFKMHLDKKIKELKNATIL